MLVTIDHLGHKWGAGTIKEVLCPICGGSVIDLDEKDQTCWKCEAPLPKLYRFHLTRKWARFHYYTNVQRILNNVKV